MWLSEIDSGFKAPDEENEIPHEILVAVTKMTYDSLQKKIKTNTTNKIQAKCRFNQFFSTIKNVMIPCIYHLSFKYLTFAILHLTKILHNNLYIVVYRCL